MSESKRKLAQMVEENARLNATLATVSSHLAKKENNEAFAICVQALNGGVGEVETPRAEALPTHRFLDKFMRVAIESQMRAAVVMLTPTKDGQMTLQLGGYLPIQRMLEKLFRANDKWLGHEMGEQLKEGG